MKKVYIFYVFQLILSGFISYSYGAIASSDKKSEQVLSGKYLDEPLFVSLGSWCNVALNLRKNGMRKSAFPFDWVASVDCEKFLEIFTTDFEYFLDEDYLFVKDSHFFNSYYHLEFPHDQVLSDPVEDLEIFKEKYTRRINRFKEIENYQGKVFFIRSSFGYSDDPGRFYRCAENVSISDEYAWRLFHTLKDKFPRLDFVLIISDCSQPIKKLSNRLIRLQSCPDLSIINELIDSTE